MDKNLLTGRYNFGVAVHISEIYVAGGVHNFESIKTVETYNSFSQIWQQSLPLDYVRRGCKLFSVRDVLYSVGGDRLGTILKHGGAKISGNSGKIRRVRDEAAFVGGKDFLLVLGGLVPKSVSKRVPSGERSRRVDIFDIVGQCWYQLHDMKTERVSAEAVVWEAYGDQKLGQETDLTMDMLDSFLAELG